MLEKVLLTILVVVIIFGIHFVTNFFFKRLILNRVSKRKETILLLFVNLVKYLGLLVGLFVILAIFGVDTASVLAGAGLLGILLGFGLQKLMQDMINGFFIIFENQYVVGEYVLINKSEGKVVELGLKTTKIATYNGEIHYIANGDIKSVVNYSKSNSLAVVDIPVLHEYSYSFIHIVIEEGLTNVIHNNIVDKPIIKGIQEVNEIFYKVRIVCRTLPFEYFEIQRMIKTEVVKEFNKNNIKYFDIGVIRK